MRAASVWAPRLRLGDREQRLEGVEQDLLGVAAPRVDAVLVQPAGDEHDHRPEQQGRCRTS